MVKIRPEAFDALVRRPPRDLRFVLLYGEDAGLIRERSDMLARTVVADLRDAFQVADMTAAAVDADPARLADEAAALSLMGGRRVVRVSGATAKFAEHVEPLFGQPTIEALVIVEAKDVTASKLKLVTLFETAPDAAAIACFPDSAASLAGVIQSMLREAKLEVAPDALDFLAANLGGDRQLTRRELEKLVLYKGGQDGAVTLADCMACIGDSSDLGIDDVVFATAGGNVAELDQRLTRLYLAGENAVRILRGVQRHFQQLQLARAGGRPVVFFQRRDEFAAQSRTWSPANLARALDLLTDAEIDCKSTGMPAEAICRHALLRIAQAARPPRGR